MNYNLFSKKLIPALTVLASITLIPMDKVFAQQFIFKKSVRDLVVTQPSGGSSGQGTGESPNQGSALLLNPSDIIFDQNTSPTNLGANSTQQVVLTNNGTASISLAGIPGLTNATGTGLSAISYCGTSLNPGQSCTIAVTFTPNSTATISAHLTVVTNVGTKTTYITATGLGAIANIAPEPGYSTSFGTVLVGNTAYQTFKFNNTGSTAATNIVPATEGAGLFISGSNNTCGTPSHPGTLLPGQACTFIVGYSPTDDSSLSGGAVKVVSSAYPNIAMLTLSGQGSLTSGVTVLKLNMDGPLGNGILTNADSAGHPLTQIGSGIVYSSDAVFSQSAFFPGGATGGTAPCSYSVAHALEANRSADFEIGGGDFTITMWLKPSSVAAGLKGLLSNYEYCNSGARGWNLSLNGTKIQYSQTTSSQGDRVTTFNTSLSANTWYHLAVVKSGTTVKVFINGVQDSTVGTYSTYASTNNANTRLRIGNLHTTDKPYLGYLDDIRIIKGGALYSSSFTPPSSPN